MAEYDPSFAQDSARINNPLKLVPGKTDAETANDLRKRLVEAYQPLLKLADEANDVGMAFQCAIGPDAFGKFQIQQCQIMKVFK